jgi:hypothetical protein
MNPSAAGQTSNTFPARLKPEIDFAGLAARLEAAPFQSA